MRNDLTDLPLDSDDQQLREKRRRFYNGILSIKPIAPAEDLKQLCNLWRELLGAKWVWLWLFHHGNSGEEGHWELTSVGAEESASHYVPTNLTPEDGLHTVAELSNTVERPFMVADINSWRRTHDGIDYRVVCGPQLREMGCRSLVCIPLLPPRNYVERHELPTAKFGAPLRAALCAHFDREPDTAIDGEMSLTLMGRLSANFIASSYEVREHRILTQMNALAEEFLRRRGRGRRAEEIRRDYLKAVIDLLQKQLMVQYASVFYRNNAGTAIYCLATSGLYDAGGAHVDNAKLVAVGYAPGESITGAVYRSGEPYFSRIGQIPKRPKYKFRETPMEVPETDLAWVAYPIYAPSGGTSGDRTPNVLGVIRCVGNQSDFARDRKRNIDPVQVQCLDFVARMLAPVLETMASNIERERVISIIKHDLFAPLRMMADSIKTASARLEKGEAPNEYFVPDIQFCIQTAINLVAGLDQSPTEIRDFEPEPTGIEGDIVAKLTSMLNHHAQFENKMKIRFGDIRSVFPHRLNIDRNLISRAFSNLIVNAVKYGSQGSVITVSARSDRNGYYLEVSNEGEGVRPEERALIFEEGYRSPRLRHVKIGLGMGLPIAKAIMEKHGGHLRLTSAANPTVFSMFFPARLEC